MQTVATVLWVAFLAWPLRMGIDAVVTLGKAAEVFGGEWEEEYAWRQCLGLATAAANLDDAARIVADERPGAAARVEAARGALVTEMAAAYGRGVGEGVTLCRSSGALGLVGVLHRQKHPGQPRRWPNWVWRLEEVAERGDGE